MSNLMKEIMKDVNGLHCQICTEMFSTDHFSPHAPNRVVCGHYVCVSCHRKLVKKADDGLFDYTCSFCKETFSSKIESRVSTGFVELLKEIDSWLCSKDDGIHPGDESPSFQQFLKRFDGMTCRRCNCLLATDNSTMQAPAQSFCGHYICKECDVKNRTINHSIEYGDEYAVICGMCTDKVLYPSEYIINSSYGYFNLLTELHKSLLGVWSRRYHKVNCSKCSEAISAAKAAICVSCETMNIDDCNKDKKIAPLCLTCIIDFHQGSDHKLEKYVNMRKAKDVEESLEKAETIKMNRDRISLIQEETKNTIESIMKNIARLHEVVGSSVEMSHYPVLKRLGAEFHNFEMSSNHHVHQMKTFSEKVNEMHRNIEGILQENIIKASPKRTHEDEGNKLMSMDISSGNSEAPANKRQRTQQMTRK